VGSFFALLLVAGMIALAQPPVKTESLFLLAGTPTPPPTPGVYPVTLYSVGPDQKLEPVRLLVPPVDIMHQLYGGLAAVRDDMNGRIYVVFPHSTSSTVSIIHKERPTLNDVVTFNPDGFPFDGDAFGVGAAEGGTSYLISPLLRRLPETGSVGVSLVTVAGDAPLKGTRVVTQDDWSIYQSFRYQGSSGGPTSPDFVPAGITKGSHVMIPSPTFTWIAFDSTPPAFPVALSRPREPTIVIVAATDLFFAFALTKEGYNSLGLTPTGVASVYVHDRRLNTWKEIKSAATVPHARRIFGSWLATIVEMYTSGNGDPDNPGRENERNYETDSLPNIRKLYAEVAAHMISIPGKLLLDNLEDGRRIKIETGQEDSEILTVRDDGLVLYRVNDSIFAAQIEGDKLSKPTLVVKDEDVPEVHWVFWTH
jgi:hypothetical protein